jgi:hypothetical protein
MARYSDRTNAHYEVTSILHLLNAKSMMMIITMTMMMVVVVKILNNDGDINKLHDAYALMHYTSKLI